MVLKISLITIIFLSLISFNFACDCSKCTASSTSTIDFRCDCPSEVGSDCKCKWFLINETASECLSCDSKLTNDDYYARVLTKDNEAFCKSLDITGFPYTKIIKGTHQIVDDCKELGLLELGDECMHQDAIFKFVDDYMDGSKQIIDGEYKTKELHCLYGYYVIIDNNGMKIHKCLKETESCPTYYNYIDSETKECLTKCPKDKPKLTKIEKNSKTYYNCSKKCDYSEGDIKYDKEYTMKSALDTSISIEFCYAICPEESHYYYETDKKCIEKCNENDFFLSNGDGKCLTETNLCTINSYFIKDSTVNLVKCAVETFNNCPSEFPNRSENNGRIYCSNNIAGSPPCTNYFIKNTACVSGCNQFILESTNGKECKNECTYYDLKNNNRCASSAVKCPNYFYNDASRGVLICIDTNICENQGYPYLIESTSEKKCSDTCDGTLSLNGEKCFESSYNCEDYTNSENIVKNAIRQCFCKFNYYYNNSTKREKLNCLGENVNCPSDINKPLLVNETKECVKYCPFKEFTKKYEKLCLRECPEGFEDKKDECICSKLNYEDENGDLICTDKCPSTRSLIANKTLCLSKCNDKFPIYFKGICYSNEDEKPHNGLDKISIEKNSDDELKKKIAEYYGNLSDYIYYCKGIWYENIENGKYTFDCKETEEKCSTFKNSYKYYIYPMRQCVKDCSTTDFKYHFNNNCYSSCNMANKHLYKNNEENDGKKIIASTDINSYECICEGYWKYNDNNEIECVKKEENKTCEDESFLLIIATNECYKGTKCPKDHPKLFNRRCYDTQCPDNSDDLQGNENTCQCTYKWYEVENDVNKTKCLSQNEECPENLPYLIVSQRKCIADNNDPYLNDKKIFLFNKYYYDNGCPAKSIVKSDSDNDSNGIKYCECNPALGYWYQIKDDDPQKTLYNCSLEGCPKDGGYILADKKTKECTIGCGFFEYNNVCYKECPEMTEGKTLSDTNKKVCELTSEYDDIEKVKEKITNSSVIVDLYYSTDLENDSEGIIEVKDGDDSYIVEYYGLNPKNDKYKSKHNNNKESLSSSLSYIDLSECINNLYKDNGMNSTDDIIVVKFDKVVTPKEYLINPVEYKFFLPVSGKELDMSACYNKKIKISYPFSKILENYANNFKKHRNLETLKLDIESEDINSLIEKYNIAKKIHGEYPEIDIFNSGDYIYTNYCSSIQVNGTDVVIEDRINSLYPHYALCEQNCTYNHTDYTEERIYCDCTLKTEFDIKRNHPENVVINENAINLSQHGSTNFPVLKCISIWKDFKRILQTIPFYYHIAIFVVEIILLILTLAFGLKTMHSYFENRICNLNNVEEDNMIIEINEKNKIKNKKHKSGYIKTTERNLENPPKKNNIKNKDNVDNNDKNEVQFIPDEFIFLFFQNKDKGVRKKVEKKFIPFEINSNTKVLLQKMKGVDYTNVKATGPFKSNQNILELVESNREELITVTEKNSQKNSENKANQEAVYKKKEPKTYFINDNDELVEDKKYDVEIEDLTCLDKFKIEQRLLRKEYEIAQYKQENGFLFLMLAEILDKIYIMNIILFRQDYDIIYINLSIYLLYHVFLVNIIAMFFDIKTIQKIWNNENYPGFGLYLGYGLASIMICWIVYIILTCLMTNKGKYNEILDIKKSKKKENKMKLVEKKYASLKRKIKIKITLYSIIQFILIIFFTIYSVTLCAIFYGTMNNIYLAYVIALIEVLVIKILYGLVLSILRQVSLSYDKKGLYNAVLFMDNYIV